MAIDQIIERFGELIKEEPVSVLSPDVLLQDTVAIEAVSPFFGYYNDAPLSGKEPYIYLILDSCYSISKIRRAVVNVKKRITHPLMADAGTIELPTQSLPVIRIKGIEKFCRIKHLQKYFMDEGITMRSSLRKLDNEMVEINLHKFLMLREVGDGLYLDEEDSSKGYFVIPDYLTWSAFKSLTKEVKYDTSILYFDAAQAVIFEQKRVIDLVRVYREDLALEKLAAIRDRYLKVLSGSAIKPNPDLKIVD